MDFGLTVDQLRFGLISFLLIAASLCLRAYGQAWMANRLGDRTPVFAGRLTLNPLPHLDVLGTVILPLVCIFFIQPRLSSLNFFLGWAKPIPMNPGAFEQPRKHLLWCLLAQTAISLLIMLVAAGVGGLASRLNPDLRFLAGSIILINACLVVLDLLPLPPLPGAYYLVHKGWMREETFVGLGRWGCLILLVGFQLPPVQVAFFFLRAVIAAPFAVILNLLAA
jgi:Zn-dependent protease